MEPSILSYVTKVQRQVGPDLRMAGDAKEMLNDLLMNWAAFLSKTATINSDHMRRSTVTSREIQSAVRQQAVGEVLRAAVSNGTRAVTSFNASHVPPGDKTRRTRSFRAGLMLPVARFDTTIRDNSEDKRVGAGSGIYLAAAVEAALEMILNRAIVYTKKAKRVTINEVDIIDALYHDKDLRETFSRWLLNKIAESDSELPAHLFE